MCAALLLTLPGSVGAADTPTLAGNWKIFVETGKDSDPWWLLKLENKDDKWTATVTPADKVPAAKVDNLVVDKDGLRFTLATDKQLLTFQIKTPANVGDKLYGLVPVEPNYVPVRLERTTLTALDSYELDKEFVQKNSGDTQVIRKAMKLMDQAADKKAKPEEVRAWADKAVKTAELYGAPYQRIVIMTVAQILTEQEGYAKIAVTYARQAERLLEPKEKKATVNKVLETLAAALDKDGKADEAKEVRARLKKTDLEKPEPFVGRKGKSERVVLVELFTGAECPPCVAADKAFDALGKAFKPSEVILLQYHLHIPRPDPLTNPDTISRSRFYKDAGAAEGTPTLLINGKLGPDAGGPEERGPDAFDACADALESLLEQPAGAKIKLTAKQADNKIDIDAEVSEAAKTGEDVHLRIVLVEEEVSYTGGNKLPVHHHVVRSFAGSTTGTVVKGKTTKTKQTIDLDEVRTELNDHLDAYGKKNPFPNKERPMELKKLKVVAFVQDDDSGEILQAAQVDVK
jgi:hypothetical protein